MLFVILSIILGMKNDAYFENDICKKISQCLGVVSKNHPIYTKTH